VLVVAAIVVGAVAKEVALEKPHSGCYCRLSTCCQKASPLNEYEHLCPVDKSTHWSGVPRHLRGQNGIIRKIPSTFPSKNKSIGFVISLNLIQYWIEFLK